MLNTAELSAKKLVIFDLDGTLVDSAKDIGTGLNQTLVKLGLPEALDQQVKQWIGNGARTLVERALLSQNNATAIAKQELDTAHQLFLKYYQAVNQAESGQKTQCYPGVRAYLDYLKSKDCEVAVVSNKPHSMIEPVLAKTGLLGDFSWWAGGDRFTHQKPDPMPLLECLAHFNRQASQALMIGDSVNDTLSAHRAEISSVAVDYGYGNMADTLEYSNWVVSSLTELIY